MPCWHLLEVAANRKSTLLRSVVALIKKRGQSETGRGGSPDLYTIFCAGDLDVHTISEVASDLGACVKHDEDKSAVCYLLDILHVECLEADGDWSVVGAAVSCLSKTHKLRVVHSALLACVDSESTNKQHHHSTLMSPLAGSRPF